MSIKQNTTSLQEILNTINKLPEGGDITLQDKTITPTTSKQTVTADSGYDGLDTVTVNAMPTATQATPTITVDSSGLITATATQTAGYVAAGTKSATKQLAFQAAKTITPGTTNQTAVSSGYYTGGAITVKGDANLVAGNIKNGTSIFGVTGTYEGSGGSVDTSMEDGMVARTGTSYTNSRVSNIGTYAFYSNSKIVSVSFPACKTIGSSAFLYCSNLTTISFPACTTINIYAFGSCYKLSAANFPKVTSINAAAFYDCYSLTTISFPACTTLATLAFAFCSKLSSVNFPKVTIVASSAFNDCYSLTTISFPACTTISQYAFVRCSNLTTISFPACTYIEKGVFANCPSLSKIYLTASSLCTLKHSNAFSGTSIWSNKGSIFVPASLVASYKAATNWTFFSNRIFSAP